MVLRESNLVRSANCMLYIQVENLVVNQQRHLHCEIVLQGHVPVFYLLQCLVPDPEHLSCTAYQVFHWLANMGHCWTTACLQCRGLQHHASCLLDDQEMETIQHRMTGCCFCRQVWFDVLSWLRELADRQSRTIHSRTGGARPNRRHQSICARASSPSLGLHRG